MCTLEKRGSVFVLTLTSDNDEQHRLNPALLSALLAALSQLNSQGTVEAAMRLGEELAQREWVGDAYAEIRKSLYPQICTALGLTPKAIVSKI